MATHTSPSRSMWPETNLAKFSLWAGGISMASFVIAYVMGGRGDALVVVAFIAGFLAVISSILAVAVLGLTKRSGFGQPIAGGALGAITIFVMLQLMSTIREASSRMKSSNNLKQIMLAMHNYESAYKELPQTIRDRGGRPLLSFRVAILPYVEEDNLYRQFHVDEPWDSPHNLSLIDPMPKVYRSPGAKTPHPTWTSYRLVTGRGTAFERPGVKLADLRGSLSNTIFVLEAGEAVPWTKPEEWQHEPDEPLPPVGGIFRSGSNVAFGDGSIRFLPRATPEATWRALIERDGNKNIELP